MPLPFLAGKNSGKSASDLTRDPAKPDSFPSLKILQACLEGEGWCNPDSIKTITKQFNALPQYWCAQNPKQQKLARGLIEILPILRRQWAKFERERAEPMNGGDVIREPWRDCATALLLQYIELIEQLEGMYGKPAEVSLPDPLLPPRKALREEVLAVLEQDHDPQSPPSQSAL